MRLCRHEIRYRHHLDNALTEHGHAIFGLWHEAMALLAFHHQGMNYHSTASYSFDGELAARMVTYFGVETVRGSSSGGGSQALEQLQRALALVPCVGITLDGPRGPRRVAKPGAAVLAARGRVPIVPLAGAVSRAWRMRSWDRFPIPKPFGRIICAYGAPISPPADDSPEAVEVTRLELEGALNRLHAEIEGDLGNPPIRVNGRPSSPAS